MTGAPASALGALLLLGALASGQSPAATSGPSGTARPGVFVLGIDGVDPVILRRLMDVGQLPEFARLAEEGTFQSLGTANPPQSPVAWSTFVTGLDPGGHGIFDFVHRDPHTYAPITSATPPSSGETPASLSLFGYVFPLSSVEAPNARSGTPFWDLLHEAGVAVEVYRMPGNFPVPPSGALTLSGMGTVDMRGEFGKYTWYTDDPFAVRGRQLKADVELVTLEDEDGNGVADTVHTRLRGPPDVFHLKPGQAPGPDDFLSLPVSFELDPEQDVVWIKVSGAEALLREGEFSEWMQVSFDALPLGLAPLSGLVRFYAKELRPGFRVYATPVNIDPSAPAQVIATPDGAAEELCEAIGFYWTQGFPEEINALKDGLFDDDDYQLQVKVVHDEAERMLDEALRRFRPGDCTFMYLSDIDLQCHMLWRHGDPKDPAAPRHPGFDPEVSPAHSQDIEGHYRNADRLLGKVRAALPPDTLLLVMSDHGFQSMTRQVQLNAWLRDQGWLALQEGADGRPARVGAIIPSRPEQAPVDWSRTRAYGVGFNGLYLNLKGRESQGLVEPAEADALLDRIAAELLAWKDPQTGRAPVLRVWKSSEIYAPERRAEAPDLVVGYDAGYGCSDESTLGEVTAAVVEDNTRGFTGNHLMAPEVVPGILLVNRRLARDGHDLTDLTVTLLRHFGVPPADGMRGTSILEP
ncbi:MAG TPA: alkaline phosphatase family protein [Planctomycetota bacterium]|nr:alkaline phosphatase family protein [Planctomycetota bacterium]